MAKILQKLNIPALILILILVIASFLRLWKLDKVPVSMYYDEIDLGYQAYSILTTGRDYSGNPWPLNFQSYADYRTPFNIYVTVPSVAIFGITPYGVRLPAAIFGILGILAFYLLINLIGNRKLAIFAGLFLAISPWHIQFSRVPLEVTSLLFFLLLGIYLFIKSISSPKLLWLSMLSLGLTPWIYSTAKLFTPLLILFLVILWRRELFRIPKKYLAFAVATLLILAVPMGFSILSGKAGMRFNYVSVFTDPTTGKVVDYSRLLDSAVGNQMGGGIPAKILSRVVHNKFTFWGGKVLTNYLESLSFDFLFINGDMNFRQSVGGMGELYKLEAVTLVLGAMLFFTGFKDKRIKLLIGFWILAGIFPSAITRDGGNHATRLILILPPLMFLVTYGFVQTTAILRKSHKRLFVFVYLLLLFISFIFYGHRYWTHYPWDSERWWSYGYKEIIDTAKLYEADYSKIVITNAEDRPEIFLAGYYPYNPIVWQKGFQNGYLNGFGDMQHIGNYYFGQVSGGADEMKNLYKVIDYQTLYIASQREVKANLVTEPRKVPDGLKLLKIIQYPSGEPAFYFFAKQ